MEKFVLVRKSQIYLYEKTPLYIRTDKGGYVLYKSQNLIVDPKRFLADGSPQLYTPVEAKELASKELRAKLKKMLLKNVKTGDLKAIKDAMCDVVDEAFQEPLEDNLQILPETLDIMFDGYSNVIKMIRSIGNVQFGGSTLVEHSVNTMVLTLNYCIFNFFSESDTKEFCLAALVHDVGLSKLSRSITETYEKLSDAEFAEYQRHPQLGYDIVQNNMNLSPSTAIGILEHHERLDGSGYPKGISDISFAGSLIGMLDTFESLTNTEKQFRKRKKPFNALKIIQDEILRGGRYDKTVYTKFCLSLRGKSKYAL